MAAIITDKAKKIILETFLSDEVDSAGTNYYIAIGKSEEWDSADTPVAPVNSLREVREFRHGIQSMKAVTASSFVAPRNSWTSGAIYSPWRDNQVGYPTNPYYVVNQNNQVYVCIEQGRNALGQAALSTVEPSGTSSSAFKTADNYVWKFLYSIGAADANNFLAAGWIPVKLVGATSGSSPVSDIEQKAIQDSAEAGQLTGAIITAAGSGYSSAPTITVIGDGTGARLEATISGGALTRITLAESAGAPIIGSGYTCADILFSGGGGTGAAARAVIHPTGFGADPRDDLKSTAIMFNTKPSGTEGGDFLVDQDFRQIGLIRNPKVPVTDSDFTAATGNALRYLVLASVATGFTSDNIIVGGTSGARAYVDNFDSDTIYYHQSIVTGFRPFTEGESITEVNGAGSGVLQSAGVDADSDAFTLAEVDKYTGDVLYIDNRAAVTRSSAQTEDIKIIIQL